MFDEGAGLQFGHCLAQLLLRIHHDRAVPCNRFLNRLARNQQESDTLVARLHHDLVAAVEEHQRVVADIVDGRRIRLRDLLVRTARGSDASRNVPEPANT